MKETSSFTTKVIETIQKIPEGKVATYSQVARLSGKPQGARGVSWILHSCSTRYKLPWHRVLNIKGKISFEKTSHNYRKQKKLLQNEGVEFLPGDQINMAEFQWKKDKKATSKSRTGPQMFR